MSRYYYRRYYGGFRVFEKVTPFVENTVEHFWKEDDAKELVKSLNKQHFMKENESTAQIQLVQIPMIAHKLQEIGLSVTKRIEELNLANQVASEDSIKFLKSTRAELNKEANDWEAQRKAVKSGIMAPYDEFEAMYKAEIIDKYKAADALLKDSIASFETIAKNEKKESIISYYNEIVAANNIDFLTFEKLGIEVNLSTSLKAYKEQVSTFVQRVADDIILIQSQENQAEIMVEYKKSLNASNAITTVVNRLAEKKREAERIKQAETDKRERLIRSMNMVWNNLTRSYHFSGKDDIFITNAEVESLSKEEFEKVIIGIDAKISNFKQGDLFTAKTATTPSAPVAPPAQVLKAPEVVAPVETLPEFTAYFEVTGTMPQLNSLKNYLVTGQYKYANLTDKEIDLLEAFRQGKINF